MAPNSKAAIAKSGWSETTTIDRSAASLCAIAKPSPFATCSSPTTAIWPSRMQVPRTQVGLVRPASASA
jgi:hypothetical protein